MKSVVFRSQEAQALAGLALFLFRKPLGWGKERPRPPEEGGEECRPCDSLALLPVPFAHSLQPLAHLPTGAAGRACSGLCLSARVIQMIRKAFTESNGFDVLGDKTQACWQEGRFLGLEK